MKRVSRIWDLPSCPGCGKLSTSRNDLLVLDVNLGEQASLCLPRHVLSTLTSDSSDPNDHATAASTASCTATNQTLKSRASGYFDRFKRDVPVNFRNIQVDGFLCFL